MNRITGHAGVVIRSFPKESFDLIVTSPPAYPSPNQPGNALGREASVEKYVESLGTILFLTRRILRHGGFLVVIIESIPGYDVLRPLHYRLKRLLMPLLASYHWNHCDGTGSAVIILTKGGGRLNRLHPAWENVEWAIPRPPPDAEYGFYEWPDELVEAITGLTIPNGGRVLDPFAGKAAALSRLGPEYDVTAVDVKPL